MPRWRSATSTSRLAATEEGLKAIGAQTGGDRMDVTERESVLAYIDAVNDRFGMIYRSSVSGGSCRVRWFGSSHPVSDPYNSCHLRVGVRAFCRHRV